ncbi:uncharacterized protein [Epargyreus clarus]|uniref:uncharacterized protein n=1 Tax=Epargyreus clarus TaxID=520877 RepID=UPI003C2D120A
MAQAEDTELRDLVIEALEKNGSLAKIRALLRANIFLAFEDECQNIKQNVSLDNVLNIPEGVLSLCIIHEFLEFCNLKNTLFVYMSESRQGKDYRYEGKNVIADKLNLSKLDKEPILLTLLRNTVKQYQKNYLSQDDTCKSKSEKHSASNYRDEQNCTYIVHEDSTATSQSQSDNSSDEKNKLHLRLPLDNSDTDTSSDSARDKTSSEYIANEHILEAHDKHNLNKHEKVEVKDSQSNNNKEVKDLDNNIVEQKVNNSSSDSTSYLELKPFNPLDKLMLNTSGLPIIGESNESSIAQYNVQPTSIVEVSSPVSISSASSGSLKNDAQSERNSNVSIKNTAQSPKPEGESADYSYDFMPSSTSSQKNKSFKQPQQYVEEDPTNKSSKNSSIESPNQNSNSSQSSISISDVADLINDNLSYKRISRSHSRSDSSKSRSLRKHKFNDVSFSLVHSKHTSDDLGDFSDSPIPSLSNLSLDIHSD